VGHPIPPRTFGGSGLLTETKVLPLALPFGFAQGRASVGMTIFFRLPR